VRQTKTRGKFLLKLYLQPKRGENEMNGKFYFTRYGLTKLHREIEDLEKKIRSLQSQIAYVADVGGDQYHDNASYEMLVIDIRGMDHQLSDLHQVLNNAILVEPPTNFDKVTIGTRARIIRDDKEMTWEIVGFGESDPDNGMLAYNTPLASLIMGKRKGEVVSGTIAGRKTEIEILEITKGGTE
jgi:transcription elongation factor GreA